MFKEKFNFGFRNIKIKFSELRTNINALNNFSLRGAKRLRALNQVQGEANSEISRLARNSLCNHKQNQIATPFGLAMTCKNDRCVCINHFEHRSLNFKGVTLIEVILIMAIIGILSTILMPRIDFGVSDVASVEGAAQMVASDIRYAQEYAMANRTTMGLIFNSGSSSYTFIKSSSFNPSGQLPSGITITTDYTVKFNSLGEPITGGGGSVTVRAGASGPQKTISVTQYTGKVSIP